MPCLRKILGEWLMRLLLLLGICLAVFGLSCAEAASGWQSFGYEGNRFVKDSGGSAILVRDGYLPVPADALAPREDRLPKGTGAIALLCFQQSSGGKLRPRPSIAPLAGMAVTISRNSLTLAARTDASGYLVLALPPGSYRLQLLGFSKRVDVKVGKTALVALRGGKRMVD